MTTLPRALRTRLNPGGSAVLRTRDEAISLGALTTGNPLSVELGELRGAHVLLKTRRQISAAMALIALDGIAARIVIAPPDLKPDHIENIIQRAEIDTLVTDGEPIAGLRHVSVLTQSTEFLPRARSADGGDDRSTGQVRRPEGDIKTEWVMFTSGTTGVPKMVAHSLEALTGAIKSMGEGVTWGTFYDIRRYGGLQIFLRAMLGDASLILSDADENIADFLARLGRDGVTHLTGTPSHWRRALMSPAIEQVHPCYVRLSGEIADQAVLDSLKDRFPV
ncbi:MAG TPA: AMP-binding protein, partial [Rhizomicrobium sp.]